MEGGKPSGGRSWTRRQIALVVALVVVVSGATWAITYYSAPRVTAVTVIGPWAGAEEKAFRPVLENFTKATGITVTYVVSRQEDLRQVLPAQFAARRTPGDVIFMISSAIREYARQGHALDVSGLISEANFGAGALDPVKVDGKVYGGIYTGKVKPGFWYRKSFFAANNLQVPATWEEFTALLDRIKGIPGIEAPIASGDGVGWPLSDVTEHFIATYGGATMHQRLAARQLAWTDASVRGVFADRIVPLLAARDFGEPRQWDAAALQGWWEGRHALYFMGSWITGMVEDPSDLGVFSLPPTGGVTPGIVFAADYLFIPKYTTRSAEAQALFRYLLSAEGQTVQVRQGGHIATAKGVALDAYPPVDREVAKLLEGKVVLTDLDDTIGGDFQTNFWNQLKLLWVSSDPAGQLDQVLAAIQAKVPP